MSGSATKLDIEACCWAADGWESAAEGSIRDATRCSRADARTFFAKVTCEPWVRVRVWKRYLRELSRQENYEWWVESRTDEGWDGHPAVAPDDWDRDLVLYDEDAPQWEFVHRSHQEAHPVWVCGFDGDDPPHDPILSAVAS